ncbi:Leucine Rich Repeat [Seminavis robusta]|uniref:Leucine Rich Repeat n=1 Tax=Seminavis robusta TaxID=568900 RepID=A0A9N8HFA0_9STRA|nr:Leucine Rich Repeat [Seminavis robusta]|eukprot:Sro558_g166320.1 Leucine Rich Repeat (763) ;mRNA; r:36078-38460
MAENKNGMEILKKTETSDHSKSNTHAGTGTTATATATATATGTRAVRRRVKTRRSSPVEGLNLDNDEITKIVEARQLLRRNSEHPSTDNDNAQEEQCSQNNPKQASSTAGTCEHEHVPGAYAGAPGTSPQRNLRPRFSLLGVTSSPDVTQIRQEIMAGEDEQRTLKQGQPVGNHNGALSTEQQQDPTNTACLQPVPRGNTTDTTPNADRPTNNENPEGLSVAEMVPEDEEEAMRHQLPRAAHFDMDESTQRRLQARKQFRNRIILGGTLFLALLLMIILMAILIPSSKDSTATNTEPSTAPAPTGMPSQMPTAFDIYIMSFLPEHSILSIQQNRESPQSKAWQWLIEQDRDSLQLLSIDRIMQKFALATLYFATAGESWTHNDNWLNHSIHECEWYTKQEFGMTSFFSGLYPGVFQEVQQPDALCDEDGLYQHLWLDQNNLVGSLPDELFLLTSLSSLSASFNKELQGPIPSQIGQLTQLEGLGISFISRGGSIPSEIGGLTKLNSLALFANDHDGTMPTELWQLSNLQTFSLIRNQNLKGTISTEIGNFQFLHHFNLGECDMSGTIPSEIGQATALEWITLHANRLSGNVSSELGRLARLQILGLFENALEGALPTELGLLTSSLVMSFRYNQLTDHVPSELGLLSNLTVSLVLANNSLSGQIPSELGLLSNLGEISLENNHFSGPVSDQLGQLLLQSEEGPPALHTLNIKGNPFLTGTVPSDLCNISGTCKPNNLDPCEEPHGLLFDCSSALCGCDCLCE